MLLWYDQHRFCINSITSSSLIMTRRVGGFRLVTSIRRFVPGRCCPAPGAILGISVSLRHVQKGLTLVLINKQSAWRNQVKKAKHCCILEVRERKPALLVINFTCEVVVHSHGVRNQLQRLAAALLAEVRLQQPVRRCAERCVPLERPRCALPDCLCFAAQTADFQQPAELQTLFEVLLVLHTSWQNLSTSLHDMPVHMPRPLNVRR